MLSFTKKNNTHPTVVAQTVEPASSSAAAFKESSSPSSIKRILLHRASRRVQKLLGLKKSVVAQLAPEPRVLFELGPASDPYRNHTRLSPSSSFNSTGADHTRTTTTHHINRFSQYDSLLPVVVGLSTSPSPCPALSPTSSFSSSLESKSLTTLEDREVAHPHSTHIGAADADDVDGARKGLTRADRVRVQQRRSALASTSPSDSSTSTHSDSSTSDSEPIIPSDFLVVSSYRPIGPSSFPIGAVVPVSVTKSSFVGRSVGGRMGGMKEMNKKEVGAKRSGFVVSHVPIEVLEGEREVVVEWL